MAFFWIFNFTFTRIHQPSQHHRSQKVVCQPQTYLSILRLAPSRQTFIKVATSNFFFSAHYHHARKGDSFLTNLLIFDHCSIPHARKTLTVFANKRARSGWHFIPS